MNEQDTEQESTISENYDYFWKPDTKDKDSDSVRFIQFQDKLKKLDSLKATIETQEQQIIAEMKKSTSRESKITIKIEPKILGKIREIVDKVERYDTVDKFVDDSLKNMTIFWLEPEKADEVAGDLWNDLTPEMKKVWWARAPDYCMTLDQRHGIHTKVATMANEIRTVKAVLSKHTFPEPENTVLGYYDKKSGSDVYPYIHETYNRFFPLKILVTSLASLIHGNLRSGKTEWIDYEEFSKECFELSLEFSNKLKEIKTAGKKVPHRNERISTGLPIWHPKAKKMESSKKRFFDCFVGPKLESFKWINHSVKCTKCDKIFGVHDELHDFTGKLVLSGALNEMGLVLIRERKGKLEITLSEDGFKFYNYKNPIIDKIKILDMDKGRIAFQTNEKGVIDSKVFSPEERKFIKENIISKFKLEKTIVENVLDSMKQAKKDPKLEYPVKINQLDTVIENTIRYWMGKNSDFATGEGITEDTIDTKKKLCRMATMGRLAEIGEVIWEIRDRESLYSINLK